MRSKLRVDEGIEEHTEAIESSPEDHKSISKTHVHGRIILVGYEIGGHEEA